MADVLIAVPAPARGPAAQKERIVPIDVLRGVALLGILVMNIQAFAMPGAAYVNPTAYGDLSGVNFAVWLAGRLLADQKFMTIFAMLFGAGIILMTQRQERAGGRPTLYHFRRNGLLILLGLMHAHLLWDGDILFEYGVCAMVAYFFRRLSPHWLIVIGLALLCIPPIFNGLFSLALPHIDADTLAEMSKDWSPTPEAIQEELAAFRGSWVAQVSFRFHSSLLMETLIFAAWTGWRVGGLMLIGMAFFKLGIFNATRPPRLYWAFILIGLPIGTMLTGLGAYRDFEEHWELARMFLGMNYNYVGSLFTSLAWTGVVMLVCQAQPGAALISRLAAVGQMALTNYILQTVLCTTLFYGHGFGLFGSVQRVGQIAIVLCVWTIELILSPCWLARFTAGPLEWVWRSLTYWRLQPLRKDWRNSDH
jgi:uncharacterized protein